MIGYYELHDLVRDTLFHGGGGGMVSLPMLSTGSMTSSKRMFDLIGFRSPNVQRGYPWDRLQDLMNNLMLDERDVEVVTRGYGIDEALISDAVEARGWQRELRPAMNWWMAWTEGINYDAVQRITIRPSPPGAQRQMTAEQIAVDIVTGSFFVLMLPPIVDLDEEVPSFIGRDW